MNNNYSCFITPTSKTREWIDLPQLNIYIYTKIQVGYTEKLITVVLLKDEDTQREMGKAYICELERT